MNRGKQSPNIGPVRPIWLFCAFLLGGVIGFPLIQVLLRLGFLPVETNPVKAMVMATLTIVMLVLGRYVKAKRDGKRSRITPIGAVRIASLAQSCAIFGAFIAGWMAAQLGVALTLGHAQIVGAIYLNAGLGFVAALALLTAGKIVEAWCMIDNGEDDSDGRGGSNNRLAPT